MSSFVKQRPRKRKYASCRLLAGTFCGNIFNRLVLYEGTYYHRSKVPGFGTDKYSGRLFQTFFFDAKEI